MSMRRALALLLLALGIASSATGGERKPVEFGVCFHHGAYGDEYTPEAAKVLDDLRAAGPFWVRGDYEDPAKDAAFAADMARKDIRVLALLPWYSKDIAGWPALVRKELQGVPGVAAWEIANEPEMSWWGGPIAPADYMRMLRDAHAIIRAAQPEARIVGPAVGATEEGVAYLEKLIDAGLLDYVDAISVHYYVFHKSQQLDAVKRLVAGRKPIWITETGWTTADQEGGQEAQRRYVEQYYDRDRGVLGADPDIEVIFNYQLNDERYPALPDQDGGWGLTYGPEGGFGKKSAYYEFRKLLAAQSPAGT
jgi:putative glycosyl hydrolase